MFLRNKEGRIVDLPARMEQQGFFQAQEVLSISQDLMNGISSVVTMNNYDAMKLKGEIMAKFPNVITDEEYLAKNGSPYKLPEKKKELVNLEMTKNEIIEIAEGEGIELDNTDRRLNKTKLIEKINGN